MWADRRRAGGASLRTPLGVADDGVVDVDLVADGPHVLVAGTTGSGKSELLRSLVAGLAALHPPSEVGFLLVDYKGGSAFDACADLPHVVGVVTDLDGHLAERVLRSLEAEVHRREELLRAAGCDDIATARAAGAVRLAPRRRDRRVRHACHRAARPAAVDRQHRPPGPQSRRAPRVGHAAARRRRQRRDPGQHQPAHRAPGAGRDRVERRRRRAHGGPPLPRPSWPGRGAVRRSRPRDHSDGAGDGTFGPRRASCRPTAARRGADAGRSERARPVGGRDPPGRHAGGRGRAPPAVARSAARRA